MPPPLAPRRLRFEVDERDAGRRHGAHDRSTRRRCPPLIDDVAARRASRRSPSRSCTPTATRSTSGCSARRSRAVAPEMRRLALVRGRAGDPRVRAHLHDAGECLCASARRALSASGWRRGCARSGCATPRSTSCSPAAARRRSRRRGASRSGCSNPARRRARWRRRSTARSPTAPNLLSFDMGGTTAKACIIDDGEPLVSRDFEVGARLPLQAGQRPAGARAGDRDDRDRRGRRLHRARRHARPPEGRAGQRGRATRDPPATAAAAPRRP